MNPQLTRAYLCRFETTKNTKTVEAMDRVCYLVLLGAFETMLSGLKMQVIHLFLNIQFKGQATYSNP